MSRLSVQLDGEHAPEFHCAKGHRLGAERDTREDPNAPWKAVLPCWRCREMKLQKDARERRKRGHVVAGVDVNRAFTLYRVFPPFACNIGRHVKLTVGHRAEARWSGHAKPYSRAIRVAYGPDATAADVLEILVHEMCHLVCPPREAHGERFRLVLRRAARELWGIEVPLLKSSERGSEPNAAYAMDRIILDELNARLARGELDLLPFTPGPTAAKPDRVVVLQALVEKRALHAVKMLARAEKKAKAAQRVLTKWRTKARYYEKVAAKKSGGMK